MYYSFYRKEIRSMSNRFSERVKVLMSKHGWSMRDLSRQSGIPYSTIYDVLESGKVRPDNLTARNLKRLARTLGTSIDHLVGTWEDDQGDGEPAGAALVSA
jgi:transcriptional regulator with XRE-family HTH domain